MGRISGLDCIVHLNGITLSGEVASFDLASGRSSLDTPDVAHRALVRLPGLSDFELTLRLWANPSLAGWIDVQNLPSKDDFTGFAIAFGPNAGDIVFMGNGLVSAVDWRRGDDGSLAGTCTVQCATADVGWFRLMFPLPVVASTLLAAARVSDPVSRSFFPEGSDIVIWASTNLDDAAIVRGDLGITLYIGAVHLRQYPFQEMPDTKLVSVFRNFGPAGGWPSAPTGVWRVGWDRLNALNPYDTTFIVAQGKAWT